MKSITEVTQLSFDGHHRNERFWSHVDKISSPIGCWLWTASKTSGGYGKFGISREEYWVRAHRFSYELANGPIPENLCVLHRCDVRACVNPSHLFLGTRKDNAQDKVAKGRHVQLDWRGIKNGKARLSEHDVREIRRLRLEGCTVTKLAVDYGVTNSNISAICTGRRWKHIR